ncbi:MAG: hypothetical protein HY849_04980, partial [Nitrosomonadales bacterium]|nr:hypothetical protein [Nitrosomonadales bacterium]
MPDRPEELMEEEKLDRIVEELEELMLDALLSILEKLKERIVRSRRL